MKKYMFKVYDADLQNFLDIQPNVSEFIRSILDDFRTKKLSYSDENVKDKLEQAKLVSLQNKNDDHSLIKRKLYAETRIAEYHADNIGVVGSRPSRKAQDAMNHHVTRRLNGFNEYVQKKYKLNYFENDELCHKALCCICEALFESKDKQEVTDDVVWHIEEIHKQRAEIVVSRN